MSKVTNLSDSYHAVYLRDRRDLLAKLKLCADCKRPTEGAYLCPDCAGKATGRWARMAASKRRAGTCVNCTEPAVPGRSRCAAHLKANNAASKARYYRRKGASKS